MFVSRAKRWQAGRRSRRYILVVTRYTSRLFAVVVILYIHIIFYYIILYYTELGTYQT